MSKESTSLVTLWCWKLDITLSLGLLSWEEGVARGIPETQWQHCSLLACLWCPEHFIPNTETILPATNSIPPAPVYKSIGSLFFFSLIQEEPGPPHFLSQNYGNWDILALSPVHLTCFGLPRHSLCSVGLPLAFCTLRDLSMPAGSMLWWVFSQSSNYTDLKLILNLLLQGYISFWLWEAGWTSLNLSEMIYF